MVTKYPMRGGREVDGNWVWELAAVRMGQRPGPTVQCRAAVAGLSPAGGEREGRGPATREEV